LVLKEVNLIAKEEGITKKEIFLFIAVLVVGVLVYFLVFGKVGTESTPQPAYGPSTEPEASGANVKELTVKHGIGLGSLFIRLVRDSELPSSTIHRIGIDKDQDGRPDYHFSLEPDSLSFWKGDTVLNADDVIAIQTTNAYHFEIPLSLVGTPSEVDIEVLAFADNEVVARAEKSIELDGEEMEGISKMLEAPQDVLQVFKKVDRDHIYIRVDLPELYQEQGYKYSISFDSDGDEEAEHSVALEQSGQVSLSRGAVGLDSDNVVGHFDGQSAHFMVPVGVVGTPDPDIRAYIIRGNELVTTTGSVREMRFGEDAIAELRGIRREIADDSVGDCTDGYVERLLVEEDLDRMYVTLTTCSPVTRELLYQFHLETDTETYQFDVVMGEEPIAARSDGEDTVGLTQEDAVRAETKSRTVEFSTLRELYEETTNLILYAFIKERATNDVLYELSRELR
jgi:hypothetical protein